MNQAVTPIAEITAAEFDKFRDFFYRKTGIQFGDSKRYFVDKRLIERIQVTGHESFRRYFQFMRFQASGLEVQELINCMTVNETYFFREEYQFECLVEETLNEIVKNKPGKPIRIWSIPSSSGEEPYSIALTLLEKWPLINNVDIEIVSSDIDSDILDRCQKGIYTERSLMNVSAILRQRYFTKLPDGNWQICKDLRDSVRFTQVNLAEPSSTRSYRGFDVIFCRNLLIYFDDASRRDAANVFYGALNPGGFVFLGHSESMSRISSLFKVRKFTKALAYQKPMEKHG